MANYELSKQLHPDFSTPGRKPVGGVEVDYAVSIASKIVKLELFNYSAATASRALLGNSGNLTNAKINRKLIFTTGSNRLDYAYANESFYELAPYANDKKFFIAFSIRFSSLPGVDGAIVSRFHDSTSTARPFMAWFDVGGSAKSVAFYVADSGGSFDIAGVDGPSVVANRTYNYVCQHTGTKLEIWRDGGLVSSTASTRQAGYSSGDNLAMSIGTQIAGSTSRQLTNCTIDYVYVGKDCLSSAEASSLTRDPYQILKPSIPMMYFTSAGGGTTYDVSVAFGLSQGMVPAGSASALGSITLANQVGQSEGGSASALGSTTLPGQMGMTYSGLASALGATSLGNQLGFSVDGIIAFDVDVTFSTSMGMTLAGTATAQGAVALSTQLSQTVSAIANAVATTLFSTQLDYSVASGQTVDVSTSFGLSLGQSQSATMTVSGEVTLAASLAQQLSAVASADGSLNLGAQIGMAVLGQASAQAGISLGTVQSMTVSGSVITFGIITPDNRVFSVQVDTRNFVIKADDRTFKP